jgi:hypothetical protein
MIRAAIATLALAVLSCDPGWKYRPADGSAGPIRAGGYQIDRVFASVFTSHLTVELVVRNLASDPLRLDPKLLRVTDARGEAIPRYPWLPEPGCGQSGHGQVVTLRKGDTCELEGEFNVDPLSRPLFRNRALRSLTIILDGLPHPDGPAIQANLEWE